LKDNKAFDLGSVEPKDQKQPSPITQFTDNYCRVCADFGVSCSCTSNSEHRDLCLEIQMVQAWQALPSLIEKLCKVLDRPVPVSPPAAANLPEAPQSEKVQRSTHPTEGHREGDIVWIWIEKDGGERYEKALEKDNQRSNDYFAVRRQILEAEDAGKKGAVIGGKWYWLSKQRDWIGRKPAKTFATGGRRY
jgi:hypothetical protein